MRLRKCQRGATMEKWNPQLYEVKFLLIVEFKYLLGYIISWDRDDATQS